MADVLSTVEYSEGKACQKVSGGEVPCNWSNDESRACYSHTDIQTAIQCSHSLVFFNIVSFKEVNYELCRKNL